MNSDRTAVLDTNVLVSGFLSPLGPPGRITEWLRTGAVRAGLDDRIFAEYREVLHRPELSLPMREVDIVLHSVARHACWARVGPEQTVVDLPDPDDAPFVECAVALGCPLVTGNARHYPANVVGNLAVISPRRFMEQLSV